MSIRKTAFVIGTALFLGAGNHTAHGFALGGPPLAWQADFLGYNRVWGYPQNIGEEYRINVPVVYWAADNSFLDYFGARGMEELDKAVAYFNNLPAYSTMSQTLAEYPEDTTRENYVASSYQLTDLKSFAMSAVAQQMGLASSEIHIWDVRDRATQPQLACPFYDFFVIKRNFDPTTWEPSSYVNGALYTFEWIISCPPAADLSYTLPVPVDPLANNFRSVSGPNSFTAIGLYFTGLTRDDVGGLRYIYRKNNYNMEQMPPDVFLGAGGGGGSPFAPVVTNAAGVVGDTTALRTGLDRVRFEKRNYDSLLGSFFAGFTNSFTVQVVTNGTMFSQGFSRAVLTPDLVFSAGNLPAVLNPGLTVVQTTVPGFDSINTTDPSVNGPGSLIVGNSRTPIEIRFQKIGPIFFASYPNFLTEAALTPIFRWGSFDGTTNAPVLYPNGASIMDLERQVLGSGR